MKLKRKITHSLFLIEITPILISIITSVKYGYTAVVSIVIACMIELLLEKYM